MRGGVQKSCDWGEDADQVLDALKVLLQGWSGVGSVSLHAWLQP